MTTHTTRLQFVDEILPSLDSLLELSFSLTGDKPSAVKLVGEALAEVFQASPGSMPEESVHHYLRRVITRRFSENNLRPASELGPAESKPASASTGESNGLGGVTVRNKRQPSRPALRFEGNTDYFKAIAKLPNVMQSTIILSCLERFSDREIVDIACAQSDEVSSLRNRSRGLGQDE